MTAMSPLLSSPSLLHVMPRVSCRQEGRGGAEGPVGAVPAAPRLPPLTTAWHRPPCPASSHMTAHQHTIHCITPPQARTARCPRAHHGGGAEGVLAHLIQPPEQRPAGDQLQEDDPPVALRRVATDGMRGARRTWLTPLQLAPGARPSGLRMIAEANAQRLWRRAGAGAERKVACPLAAVLRPRTCATNCWMSR